MATSAHTEVPAGGRGPFPPFQKETFASQLLWFAIAFIALYLIISRLAIPRIGGFMAARSNAIADDLAEAAKLKDQSDAALAAYEKSLNDARARAQALANETRDRLNAEAEQTRKRLEAELNSKLVAAEGIINDTKRAAMVNVQAIAVETAVAIIHRLIGTAPAAKAVEGAVADVLKR
jgi:F-type H+-transporting ATPase subunit b